MYQYSNLDSGTCVSGGVWHNRYCDGIVVYPTCRDRLSTEQPDVGKARLKSAKETMNAINQTLQVSNTYICIDASNHQAYQGL